MGLRDIGATLPPGFRFYPSDEELVCHYLHKKIANEQACKGTLVEIDLHVCEPWQLPEEAKLNTTEWYFFSFRDRKYATGFRTNRATTSGYWKATGKDRVILDPRTKEIVGMRKTLVFYQNRAPNGIKTGWIMHEFRLESPHMPPKEDWVLCRVFHKSKQGENNNNNVNQCQQMFDYTTPNSSSPPPLIASPTLSNTTHHNNLLCEHQKPNSFTLNNPSFSQKSMFCPNNNDSNLNYNNNNNHVVNPSSYLNPMKESYSFSDLINSSAKNDDAYGLLWDMDIEENSKLGDEESGHVFVPLPQHDEFGDNIRFQDDCGAVFI